MVKGGQSGAALRVVERAPFFERELKLADAGAPHSLHDIISFPGLIEPDFSAFFVDRYSKKGETVLDPFCSAGVIALEAALRGRVVAACDLDQLAARVTYAKLNPSDITEVTLALQRISFRRPITLEEFRQHFTAFYNIDTYRELVNLKSALAQQSDRSMRFIELLALSLLHGNSAGSFSVYSSPQLSLSVADQERINYKRCQSPDYRAVMPRILRKAAMSLRDGVPSSMRASADLYRLANCDARDMTFISNSSVNLVLTEPPLPRSKALSADQWLRGWFAGFPRQLVPAAISDQQEWLIFMNEVLFELARVTKASGRCVLLLRSASSDTSGFSPESLLVDLINENLSRFWEPEGVFVERRPFAKLKECLKERDHGRRGRQAKALVLRRR